MKNEKENGRGRKRKSEREEGKIRQNGERKGRGNKYEQKKSNEETEDAEWKDKERIKK